MDIERFVAGLPALFEDFPASPHPRGTRFDDVLERTPNLAEENVLALLNLAASLLAPGESYVEVGSYYRREPDRRDARQRRRLRRDRPLRVRAARGEGRQLPAASRAGLEENLRRFDAEGATILEGDAFEVLEGGRLGDRRVGVYYFDGPHDYDSEVRGLRAVAPWLADEALLVVDDHDWDDVARATRDYLAAEQRAELLFDIPGGDRGEPQWWDGVAVLGWRG